VGVSGVNVHTFPGAGYELFNVTHTGGSWRAAVAPEYYGLLMFARATPPGSRLVAVGASANGALHTWATRARDGTVRVVLTNGGSSSRVLAVRIDGADGRASLYRLTAPSASATSGVTLGGQSFGAETGTGLLAGQSECSSVTPADGRYVVSLPATSAALLVLPPH
jgi:hypothetical protein